ncbi:MAG: fumarylacetoacetase [Rubrivivax sp.]|nr:fumarylacetoacetase [Rubrivivax sp.]
MTPIDDTHDPALRSWVESANDADTDFPLQNLPLGMFRGAGETGVLRAGVAIGDQVLDLHAAAGAALLDDAVAASLGGQLDGTLNTFMALGAPARQALRSALSAGLREGAPRQADWQRCMHAASSVEMGLPCRISDYTDFYAGIHHARAVGKLFRPDNPLLPNYTWVPSGYHGRASSIGVSGQTFRRPRGQTKAADAPMPEFGPSKRIDYELELGLFIGRGNALGEPIAIERSEDHACGVVLLNDWSARDIQAWEYQPLGPFLAKSFATTISPWIVTLEALAPFRSPFTRPAEDPKPLPYLDSADNRERGAVDIGFEVLLQTRAMRAAGLAPQSLMQSNFRDAYWTLAQMLTHHASNGCNLQAGDLLGSGTQSGPRPGQGGSLLELTDGGKTLLTLASGEQRRFLEDGDSVVLRGRCTRAGYRSIGFGACEGTVLAALTG